MIIKPSEIYDELKAKEIMDRALEMLDAVCAFFKSLNMVELEGVLEEMERCLKRLKAKRLKHGWFIPRDDLRAVMSFE